MSRLILACGTSVFHPHKRRRSFCSPECFLCSDTDWQEQRRGGKGKERKGSAEARSAQNPASEHKPLNRIFKKGFFVIWWRRWMTECFFKMSFMGNIQNVFSSQVVRYQMLLRHTAHARKSLTSVYAPTYKPCSRNPSCTSSASSSSSWLGNKRPFHSKILWIYEL